ncbi:MAG: cytochrome P450, partial [Myxococcales bacterium]|nr:cytochrome P450 [Myxococcales bacterium]
MTWLFFLLSRHPEVARKVEHEVARELDGQAPVAEDLDRLVYLEQVIQETLRVYPPAFMLPREVVSEDRIGGYTIPAKAWVVLSPYVTHRRADFWENPEGFDPERFTPEASAGRHPAAYFPFFLGPHKCIGQGMAMMEMKTVVATVLQRCRLDLHAGFEPRPDAQISLRTKDGMLMRPRWR